MPWAFSLATGSSYASTSRDGCVVEYFDLREHGHAGHVRHQPVARAEVPLGGVFHGYEYVHAGQCG